MNLRMLARQAHIPEREAQALPHETLSAVIAEERAWVADQERRERAAARALAFIHQFDLENQSSRDALCLESLKRLARARKFPEPTSTSATEIGVFAFRLAEWDEGHAQK